MFVLLTDLPAQLGYRKSQASLLYIVRSMLYIECFGVTRVTAGLAESNGSLPSGL